MGVSAAIPDDYNSSTVDKQERSLQIKEWALAEGFDLAGVARLERARTGEQFLAWLTDGNQAGMAYLERRTELRLDPRRILPGANSAVCVALRYHPLAGEPPAPGDLWPRVARYARGTDYHELMQTRLESLAGRIRESYPATETRAYVDTGPVLERELAARAGLGAVGKNTNLLNPEIGSWFLLGELFTSLELTPDPAIGDLCGSCSQCLEACPTGALPEPWILDSRRCISYWTIEHRGVLPLSVRPLLGDWVFGCDICQEVCPLNAEVASAEQPDFRLTGTRSDLDLADLLGLRQSEYAQLFRGSAMKRAKLGGLQRNAAVAMGNSRSRAYVPALIQALQAGDSPLRQHVSWALGQIGGEGARSALAAAIEAESETAVRQEIEAALERIEA